MYRVQNIPPAFLSRPHCPKIGGPKKIGKHDPVGQEKKSKIENSEKSQKSDIPPLRSRTSARLVLPPGFVHVEMFSCPLLRRVLVPRRYALLRRGLVHVELYLVTPKKI